MLKFVNYSPLAGKGCWIPKFSRLIVFLSSMVIFAILTFEELRPLWGASTHYDPWDIAASGVGSLLAILTFELITMIRNK